MRKRHLIAVVGMTLSAVISVGALNAISVDAEEIHADCPIAGVNKELANILTQSHVKTHFPISGSTEVISSIVNTSNEDIEKEIAKKKKEKAKQKALEDKKKEEELKKKAEEEVKQASYELRLQELFGYVPAQWEINEFLSITQAECGNTEPWNGIKAVEYVIINRVKSSRYPNTLHGVLSQSNQFETWSKGLQYSVPNDRVKQVWNEILYSDSYNPYPNVLFFTAGGYNPYCRPGFVINNHYFGY